MPRSHETKFIPRLLADEKTVMRCHLLNFITNIDRNLLIPGDFKLRCPRIDGNPVGVENYPTTPGRTTEIFHGEEIEGFVIDLFVVTGENTGHALMQGRSFDEVLDAQPRPTLGEEKDELNLLTGVELYTRIIEGLVRATDLYNEYGEWRATASAAKIVLSTAERESDPPPKIPGKLRRRNASF